MPRITGYAAVFYRADDPGTTYALHGGRVEERIAPGAFDRTLKSADVVALFNHDESQLLGRMRAKTLKLEVDGRGLRYTIEPPETTIGRDVVESIRRGDIDGSSFGFRVKSAPLEEVEDGRYVRTIEDVDLYDVGPVTTPAYESTKASLSRSANRELEAFCDLRDRERRLRALLER